MKKAFTNLAFIAAGALLGCIVMSLMMILKTYDFSILLYIFIWLAGFLLVGILFILFQNTLAKELSVRRAAMRALGKGGIVMVAKDKSAKTAYKGITAMLKGNFPRAEELLNKALYMSDSRNNKLFCIQWLRKLYEAADNDDKLMWCARKAVEYAPDNPEYQSALGHEYFVKGNFARAEECFNQAVHYDPNNGYSRFSLARIYLLHAEYERAEKAFIDLLEINQNHPLIYSELSILYAMQSESDKCREYYNKAIASGYEYPDRLAASISAIFNFNNSKRCSGEYLPSLYYRRIPEEEDKTTGCGHECKYCMLNKKEKGENDAGDE